MVSLLTVMLASFFFLIRFICSVWHLALAGLHFASTGIEPVRHKLNMTQTTSLRASWSLVERFLPPGGRPHIYFFCSSMVPINPDDLHILVTTILHCIQFSVSRRLLRLYFTSVNFVIKVRCRCFVPQRLNFFTKDCCTAVT